MSKEDILRIFYTNNLSLGVQSILLIMLGGLCIGLIIALCYYVSCRSVNGVQFNRRFAVSLITTLLISVVIMLMISSNIVISLGMVGALSIVRFRTAVKDPMDTAYMFWALTMGILLGAELYVHALMVVLVISVILILLSFLHFGKGNAYLLVVHYDDYAEQDITQLLRRTVKQRKLRSKTVTRSGAEMTVEVRLDNKQDLVAAVLNLEGVHDATLVACQTEAGA